MAVESATYIGQLNSSYPPGSDPRSQGDDHLRLIKAALQATFPGLNGVWTSVAHTFTATQTIKSTDAGASAGPDFVLHRDSASPAANDYLGQLLWKGEDTASNADTFAAARAQILDATSTSEDGQLEFGVITAGSLAFELALTGAALFPLTNAGLDLGASSFRFGTAYMNTLNADAGGTLGDASVDTVVIKGTTVSTYMAGLFDEADRGALRQEVLAATDAITALASNDVVLVYDATVSDWRQITVANFFRSGFDAVFGSTKGQILYRTSSQWSALNPP